MKIERVATLPLCSDYMITRNGEVWSLRSGKLQQLKGGAQRHGGYLRVKLYINNLPRTMKIHRLVAMCFLPAPRPEQNVVRHLDGNVLNNDVSNLAWGTHADNHQDAIRHGTTTYGERSHHAKLTEAQVLEILSIPRSEASSGVLSRRFGVSRTNIKGIRNGKIWTYLSRKQGDE